MKREHNQEAPYSAVDGASSGKHRRATPDGPTGSALVLLGGAPSRWARAAVLGLLAAACQRKPAPSPGEGEGIAPRELTTGSAGGASGDSAEPDPPAAKDCCMGKNECRGKGGCAVPESHACAGKNACAGRGGCRSRCPG